MGLEERENKRKKSLIGSMIADGLSIETEKNLINTDETELINYQEIVTPKEREETRSKRLNLLLKPSVYAKAQKKCEKLGISLNECINQFLDNWVK